MHALFCQYEFAGCSDSQAVLVLAVADDDHALATHEVMAGDCPVDWRAHPSGGWH
jgi:hypothetical protein